MTQLSNVGGAHPVEKFTLEPLGVHILSTVGPQSSLERTGGSETKMTPVEVGSL